MFISSSSRLHVQLRYNSMSIHMNLSTGQVPSVHPRDFCSLWCLNALVEFLTCQLLIPRSLTSTLCSDIVYPDFAFSSSSSVLEGKCLHINLKSVKIASHNLPTPTPAENITIIKIIIIIFNCDLVVTRWQWFFTCIQIWNLLLINLSREGYMRGM